MDRSQVEAVLANCEQALAGEGDVDLAALGFWKAVAVVKRHPDWVDGLAGRVGDIDRKAFGRWAPVTVPAPLGTILMVAGTLLGLALIGLAYGYQGFSQAALLLVGTGILLLTTHGLAHLLVASLQGMKVTHWFIGSIKRPQPGVKIDYNSYLRVPASQRAWMHASGAIVTKLIPLVGLGAGLAMGADAWAIWLLAVVAVVQVVIDVVWSTKSSDWKKFKRERGFVD